MHAFLCILIACYAVATNAVAANPAIDAFRDRSASYEERHEALRQLVQEGEKGWSWIMFALTNDLSPHSDFVREMESIWDATGIPEDVLKGYADYRSKFIAAKSENETWAILYTAAETRSKHHNAGPRGQQAMDHYFVSLFSHLDTLRDRGEWRPHLAKMRVLFAQSPDFPGHTIPWDASDREKREWFDKILEWWQGYKNKPNESVQ